MLDLRLIALIIHVHAPDDSQIIKRVVLRNFYSAGKTSLNVSKFFPLHTTIVLPHTTTSRKSLYIHSEVFCLNKKDFLYVLINGMFCILVSHQKSICSHVASRGQQWMGEDWVAQKLQLVSQASVAEHIKTFVHRGFAITKSQNL